MLCYAMLCYTRLRQKTWKATCRKATCLSSKRLTCSTKWCVWASEKHSGLQKTITPEYTII